MRPLPILLHQYVIDHFIVKQQSYPGVLKRFARMNDLNYFKWSMKLGLFSQKHREMTGFSSEEFLKKRGALTVMGNYSPEWIDQDPENKRQSAKYSN